MLQINTDLQPADLHGNLVPLWELSAKKIRAMHEDPQLQSATPVFTVGGRYQPQGWTEWTQGFQFGCQILQFDATGDETFLEMGRRNTLERMAPHLTHFGVHDHGFNNVSTYGNLRRLMLEGRMAAGDDDSSSNTACFVSTDASNASQLLRSSVPLLANSLST